ncbi:MAG: cupin domain-containing protein [Terracidiphilus sp.]|jgi:mannose-6-phosphate isomerase-like protein (cupin superfamily)
MDRRAFSALLPMLFAAPALAATAEAQTSGSPAAANPATPVTPPALPRLVSGQYLPGEAQHPNSPRVSRSFLRGMLPDNIRLESHVTVLAPGAPAEPIDHHKHSEMWFVREGTVTLMTAGVTRTLKAGEMGLCIAGDDHCITNASKTESASYFVVSVGPPE